MPSLLVQELTEAATALAEAALPGARVVTELRREHGSMERASEQELKRAFNGLGVLLGEAADSQGGLLYEASREETGRIMAILAAADVDKWTKENLKPMLEKQWERVIKSTLKVLGKHDIKISARSKLESKMLKQGGVRLGLLDIKGEAKASLFRVLEEGRVRGLNPRETGRMIREFVPEGRFVNAGVKYRAELIARTETLEAQRHSSIRSYESSPVVKGCVAFDGDFDAECIARNGTEVTFAEAMQQAEGTHPNCVLAYGPVV